MEGVEDTIRAKDPKDLTPEEKKWITDLDERIVFASLCNQLDVDEVPLPFQLPPCSNPGDKDLPVGYEYIVESHLNWQRVYTYNIQQWKLLVLWKV